MPGRRLSARIREGRQNSRGRTHALPKERCGQAALRQWPGALAHPIGCLSGLPRFSLCEIRHKPPLLQFFARPCSFPVACSAVCAWKSISGMPCHLCSASAHQSRQSKASLPEPHRFSGFGPAGFAKQQVALDWQCAASYAQNSSRFANSKISPLMPLPLRRSSARHPRVQKGRTRLACRKAGRCGPGLPSGREST